MEGKKLFRVVVSMNVTFDYEAESAEDAEDMALNDPRVIQDLAQSLADEALFTEIDGVAEIPEDGEEPNFYQKL